MKRLFPFVLGAGLVCGATLLACASDDDDATGTSPPPAPDAQADTSAPPVVTDAGDAGADADSAPPIPRPPFDASAPEITCAVTPCMKRIVAGPRAFCAIAADETVRCWGDPSVLGDFTSGTPTNPGATPVPLTGIGTVADIGISNYGTCFIDATSAVRCFGNNSATPELVPDVTGAKKIVVGDDRRCAILTSGDLSCWGDNFATGSGPTTYEIPGEDVVAASSQFFSAFALGSKGTLLSWGAERYSLGRNTAVSPDLTPSPVLDLPPIMQYASSDNHVCALTPDGHLYCWGRADTGALGLGYVRHEFKPVEVAFPGPEWPAEIFVSQSHSCTRMTDGSLMCWASGNWFGELGYAATTGVYIPTTITSATKKVHSVALGLSSTCALYVDGSVQCWGDNNSGQLGQGTRDNFRHPTPTTVTFP